MKQQQPVTKQTIWMLWGAMLFSLFVLGGVSFVFKDQNIDGGLDPTLFMIIFATAAFFSAILSLLARPFVLKKLGENEDRDTVMNTYMKGSIVSWALVESMGILGLLSYILTKNGILFGSILGSACVLHLIMAPSNRKIDQLLE